MKRMKIVESMVKKFVITSDTAGMDAISVFIEEPEPHKAILTVRCYGKVWSACWHMMRGTLSEFLNTANVDYIASKLSSDIDCRINDYDELGVLLKIKILELRRAHEIDDSLARDIYDDIEGINSEWCDYNHNVLTQYLGGDWFHNIPKKENPQYVHLCNVINIVKKSLSNVN